MFEKLIFLCSARLYVLLPKSFCNDFVFDRQKRALD